MIGVLIGLAMGVGACEVVGRHLGGYSIVMDAVERVKSLG